MAESDASQLQLQQQQPSQQELMDEKEAVYEYLCRLEESKKWIEAVTKESLPVVNEFENMLRNGVVLCKLGMKLLPGDEMWRKVYDLDMSKYKSKGLDYRHTDNINFFLTALHKLGVPKVFHPVVTDIFNRKNMPKLIYCLHALSHLLKKEGMLTYAMDDIYTTGKVQFTSDIITQTGQTLKTLSSGPLELPAFSIVENLVEEELQYKAMAASIGGALPDIEEDAIQQMQQRQKQKRMEKQDSKSTTPNGTKSEKQNSQDYSEGEDEELFDDPSYLPAKSWRKDAAIAASNASIASAVSNTTTTTTTTSIVPGGGKKSQNIVIGGVGALSSSPLPSSPVPLDPSSKPFADVFCQDKRYRALLYLKKGGIKVKPPTSLEMAVKTVNDSLEVNDRHDLLKALQEPSAKFPFAFNDQDLYFSALAEERENGVPNSILVVYSGLTRETSENLLEKLIPGAFLVRDSDTMPGVVVFSFRNQTGMKHWVLQQQEGHFWWGKSRKYDTLESFIDHFVDLLASATNLYIYSGVVSELRPVIERPEHVAAFKNIRLVDSKLSYGQITCVIKQVNLARQSRRASLRSMNVKPDWTPSMIMSIRKLEAENILNIQGKPGTFLVRPSERVEGDFALAFKTHTEIRHWRIVKRDDQFYVHPRPNPYISLKEIVLHFQEAVGVETGLVMYPLNLGGGSDTPPRPVKRSISAKQPNRIASSVSGSTRSLLSNQMPPPLKHTSSMKSFTISRAAPTQSLSRLNPANLTSWSVEDVCQWLFNEGLEKFENVFRENAIDGECLLNLDNSLLKSDLGITALGYRSRILRRVDALKEKIHPRKNT